MKDVDFYLLRAEIVTRKHMQRVSQLLGDVAIEFINRAKRHDLSKLEEVEMNPLAEMQRTIDKEGQVPYESEEYKRRTEKLGPMLESHFAKNSHHPEYYVEGVSGMDLFDILEMLIDWKAASERGEESVVNIDAACKRFKIDGQLRRVLENTADELKWTRR